MRRFRSAARVAGLVVTAVLLAAGGAEPRDGVESGDAEAPPGITGSGPLLNELYDETGAARDLPGPSWSDYGRLLSARFARWFGARLRPLGIPADLVARALAYGFLALVLAALAVLLWRLATGPRGQPGPPLRGPGVPPERVTPRAVPRRDEPWRSRIDEHLARGDVEAALEAAWWWLAVSTTAGDIDTSWTSRELLDSAGRRDLDPQARILDRMAYGPTRPSPDAVRRLVSGLEIRLA